MADERYDISITKEYLIRNKAKLLYISSATYSGDWLSTPHTHYCSELFYVLEGIGQFQVEDKIFPVKANDLIIFYLQMMLKEIETRAPGHEAICQDLMEILIVLFGRQTNFSTILTPANKKASHLCDSVRRYLNQNCEEDITLEQLARFSHVNKYYLVHSFTKHFGCSPISYLNDKRIEESKNLLETTNHSIAAIASMIGFSSQSYFSQSFKKNTFMTPNEYRRASRQI